MNTPQDSDLHDAVTTELQLAHVAAGRPSAPKLEEATGIGSDTIRRTLKGDRAVTAVELMKLGHSLDFDPSTMLARAAARASEAASAPKRLRSARLIDKIALLATSAGRSVDSLYLDVVGYMSERGYHFPKAAWNEMLVESDTRVRREVLFAIADALDFDPRYLLEDSPDVDQSVEARLRFHRAMRDLGIEEIAARAVDDVNHLDYESLQVTVKHAIDAARRSI